MRTRSRAFIFATALTGPFIWASTGHAHAGHTDAAAWQVCADKAHREVCEYSNLRHDLYKGTCQKVSGKLLCVRNKPIEKHQEPANGAVDEATTAAPPGQPAQATNKAKPD